jgi:SulP family sulfate permease
MRKWLHHPLVPKVVTCLMDGYRLETFKKDLFAGLTLGVIALPLALAFAIASGVEPSRGFYRAVVAGFIISLLGGGRVWIGGPTGAFVVIIYSTIERHGYEELVMATFMASLLLIAMGLSRVGQLIKYIPYSLIIGFTTGLSLLVFSSQIKDLFGFPIDQVPVDFYHKWMMYLQQMPLLNPTALSMGCAGLVGIVALRKWMPSFPWGITIILAGTFICWVFHLDIATIGSRYGALPQGLPSPSLPSFLCDVEKWQALLPDAVAIAVLAGLESLLSAVMGDGMTGSRHKPDCELVAQGLANAASVIFGGILGTGAIARTAANVKTGAKTPIAGMIHAIVLLLIMLLFSPLVAYIPLTTLAAVLVVVAWNMCELPRFIHAFKAPRGDVAVMLTAFILTVVVDLSFAVQMAMILALFLFMRRMSDRAKILQPIAADADRPIPQGMEFYRVQGPLFFGVADKIKDLAHPRRLSPQLFLLEMEDVHVLDASGMYALRELAAKCRKEGTHLLLSQVHKEVYNSLKLFGLLNLLELGSIFSTTSEALVYAHTILSSKNVTSSIPDSYINSH